VTQSQLFRLLCAIPVTYVVLCVLVGVFQRKLLYFPFHQTEAEMMDEACASGCRAWRDGSGNLLGWKSAGNGQRAANRLVVFHGNAGYALHRTHYIKGFEQLEHGRLWEVYLFEYPGYGARPGKVGQRSFDEAGLRALEALRAEDSRPIYLAGESLGSGLACKLAQRKPADVAGLFLVTPYARMTDVAAHHYGLLPVRLLMLDRWDNVAALHAYHGPLAMLIAGEDEVVTAAQGHLLFDGYGGPKRLWVQPGAGHNTLNFSPDAPWWREVSDFLLSGHRRDDTHRHLSPR
jgi:alpha-beta hydrolase superfamily lysophospholipase